MCELVMDFKNVFEANSDDRLEYKPISVRALLTELQTLTTFMVDLAYSAVLFNDYELAQEVIEFEERVNNLGTLLLMNTAIAVRDAEDAEAMTGIMRMGAVADRVSHAAGSIARIVLSGLGIESYVLEAFSRSKERLVKTKVLPGSILSNTSLEKLMLEVNIGVDIMAIRHVKELMVKPDPKTILYEGDIIIARGSDVGVLELDKLAKGELNKIPRPRVAVKERHL